MIDQTSFTLGESIPFYGILITVVAVLVYGYMKGYRAFWSPLTIIAIVFGYYCCVGPYEAISTGDTHDRLLNMRKYYPSAFWGAWISLLSIILGFVLQSGKANQIKMPSLSDEVLMKYGIRVVLIGIILFSISTGGNVIGLINPLDADSLNQTGGSFSNYFNLSINFLIPGVAMLFAYYVRTGKGLWIVIGCFLVGAGLYTTLGFRYRLILLLSSMVIVYYQTRRKTPNLIVAGTGIVVLIILMGIINLTRNYGSGLNLSRLEGNTSQKYYKSGLNESKIFATSGAIIDIVPDKHPHAGFEPIWSTLLFPVPRTLYKEKSSAEYLFDALDAVYGKKLSKGAAFLMYAEYYLSFGWMGLVCGSFLLGWVYKKLWQWYLANQDHALVAVTYAVSVSYLYMIISRGYLPQVTMLYFFSAFPAYVVLRIAKKRVALGSRKIVAHAS